MRFNLSIYGRMAIGFGLVIGLILLLSTISIKKLHQVTDLEDTLNHVIAERVYESHNIETNFMDESIALHSYIATRNSAYLRDYRKYQGERHNATVRLEKLPGTQEGTAIFDRIKAIAGKHEAKANQVLALVGGSAAPGELDAAEDSLRTLRTQLLDETRQFAQLQNRKRMTAAQQLDDVQNSLSSRFYLISACILVICILVAGLTIQAIRRPAGRIVEAIHAAEHGDYAPATDLANQVQQYHGTLRNELLVIAGAFGRMAGATQSREANLAADSRVTALMASTLDIKRLAADTLNELIASAAWDCGAIYLHETENHRLHLLAQSALAECPEQLSAANSLAGKAMGSQQSVLLHDLPEAPPLLAQTAMGNRRPVLLLVLPILFQNQPLGLILLGAFQEPTAVDRAFAEHTTTHLGVSLRNVLTHQTTIRLNEELTRKAQQLELQNQMLQAQSGQLQIQSEQLRLQNEEIQAQNEEIQVQSEELQAQNEELNKLLAELRESQHQLSYELEERKQLEQELRRQTAALVEADRRKNEFLAMLAHELRNPLAAISNAGYILDQGAANPEQAARQRKIITRQVRHLAHMVDDLLDVSRITRGRVELRREPVNLIQAVQQAIDANRNALESQQQDLSVQLPSHPVIVEADPTRLEQMIGNLIHNAVKFTPPEGRIHVVAEVNGKWAILHVQDNGVGITSDILPFVFDLFTQAESGPDRAKGGLGIGLTLVRTLAELHGGSVEAHSGGTGQGSEFVLQLPLLELRNA